MDTSDSPAPARTRITLATTGTGIEDEHRSALRALLRCEPQPAAFDASRYDPAAVAEARGMWRIRMRAEHESVPALTALVGQLIEAGATLDAQGAALRMALDELRHTEICGEVLRALGDDGSCEIGAPVRLPVWPGVSPEERALRNVIFGNALVEAVNTANLVDVHDSMSDPCLREATRQLLSDEVQHAAFGFDYLEAWGPWLAERPEVRASLDGWLRRAFFELERARASADPRPRALTPDQIALGIPDPARVTLVLHQTVVGAIVPALERFGLDATAAWKERSATA